MSEFRRVLLSKKTLILLVLAVCMSCVFFAFDFGADRQITLQGAELAKYIESYPSFLEGVSSNADNLRAIEILQEENSFSQKNIEKTASDYSALNITVQSGENQGIVLYSDFIAGDFVLLALVIYLVTRFSEERRNGLFPLVNSTKNGRVLLAVQRVGITLFSSVIFSVLLTAAVMITAAGFYGDMGLLRPIQSVPEFKLCAVRISVLDYLALSVLMKALAAAVCGLLVYFLCSVLEPLIAYSAAGIIFGAQYLLYSLIIPTDRLNILKYANVFSLLRADVFFKAYLNISIFGEPIYFAVISAVVMAFALIILSVVCAVIIPRLRAIQGGEVLSGIIKPISRRAPQIPLFLWETRKLLIGRRGLVVFAAAIFLAINSAAQYRYVGGIDERYEKLYAKYGGTVTDALTEQIHTDCEAAWAEVEELQAAFSSADNSAERDWLAARIADRMAEASLLSEFAERADNSLEYTRKTGISVELINEDTYNILLAGDRGTAARNGLYILIAIVLMFGGIISSEKRQNMDLTLKSTRRGRSVLLCNKLALMVIVSAVLSLTINLFQLMQIAQEMGLNNLDAPCQSIVLLRGITLRISIREYLFMLYAARVLCAFLVGAAVMLISRVCSSEITSIGVSAALLIAPSLLHSAGLEFMPSFAGLMVTVIK